MLFGTVRRGKETQHTVAGAGAEIHARGQREGIDRLEAEALAGWGEDAHRDLLHAVEGEVDVLRGAVGDQAHP